MRRFSYQQARVWVHERVAHQLRFHLRQYPYLHALTLSDSTTVSLLSLNATLMEWVFDSSYQTKFAIDIRRLELDHRKRWTKRTYK